jgi:hypothetical protein
MKLRYALRDGRVRSFGPEGRGVGASGGEGGGGRLKAPNPQAPSPRETSISNHQTGNSDAWIRLNTLKYAWQRLAVPPSRGRYGGQGSGAGSCDEKDRILQELPHYVRVSADKSGYVRVSAAFRKIGAEPHLGRRERRPIGQELFLRVGKWTQSVNPPPHVGGYAVVRICSHWLSSALERFACPPPYVGGYEARGFTCLRWGAGKCIICGPFGFEGRKWLQAVEGGEIMCGPLGTASPTVSGENYEQ